MTTEFFFLRPWWLLALAPTAALLLAARRAAEGRGGPWRHLVDAHLLRHLGVGTTDGGTRRRHLVPLGLALALATLALAGPTWERGAQPAVAPAEPNVIVLSLSQSMNATDVSPSRLVRAGHKVRDLVARGRGGDTGFVVYADRPFVAAPLTADGAVIESMLAELSTDLVPVVGNRLDLAIDEAAALLERAGARSGRILVLADDAGDRPDEAGAAAARAAAKDYEVDVIGIGTEAGATLRSASGRPITHSGETIVTRLETTYLQRLATSGKGRFVTLTADDGDIDALLPPSADGAMSAAVSDPERTAETWKDAGYWLLLPLVPLAMLAFRRNLLFALPLGLALALVAPSERATAGVWSDLWRTPDQQAADAFERDAFDAAAMTFERPDWRASALYRAGRYEQAAEGYAASASPDGAFNRGNALAKAGRLEDALDAYDAALALEPDDEDAAFNRELVADLLERQRQEQEGDDQQGQQGDRSEQGQQGGQAGQGQQGDRSEQGQPGEQAGQGQQSDRSEQGPQNEQAGQGEQGDRSEQGRQGDRSEQGPQGGQAGQGQQGDQPERGQQGEQAERDQQGDGPEQGQRSEHVEQGRQGQPSSREADGVVDSEASSTEDTTVPDEVSAQASAESARRAFGDAIDAELANGGAPSTEPSDSSATETPPSDAVAPGASVPMLDQASEQELRAVPDDPSGLLRARILRHYARERALAGAG